MANKGNIIKVEELVREDDYLQSANGEFIAYMHVDGCICIYRGWPERDKWLWQTHKRSEHGPHCACLHKDGNLCIYPGEHPEYGKFIWQSHKSSPLGQYCLSLDDDGNLRIYKGETAQGKPIWQTDIVQEIVEISKIEYQFNDCKILSADPIRLYNQTVTNDTSQEQSSTIAGSETVSETFGWSETTGIKVGAKTNFRCGFPCIAEGKVEVSTEVSQTFTFNKSTTNQKSWSFSTPVRVPPYTTIIANILATKSKISVPYALTCKVKLQDGRIITMTIRGVFIGDNSHDLEVKFQKKEPNSNMISTWSEKLHDISCVSV